MAKYNNGINGPFSGKIGSVVGSSRNGVNYMKSAYKKRTKKAGIGEQRNRDRFALAQHWLSPLLPFLRTGFKGYSETSYGFIAAKSALLRNAIIDSENGFFVDPALAKVSFGELPLPQNLKATLLADQEIKVSWDKPQTYHENEHPDDQVMLLAYNIATGEISFTVSGQFRKTGSDLLLIDKQSPKDQSEPRTDYHIYAAFNAVDRSKQSDSVYLGVVSV